MCMHFFLCTFMSFWIHGTYAFRRLAYTWFFTPCLWIAASDYKILLFLIFFREKEPFLNRSDLTYAESTSLPSSITKDSSLPKAKCSVVTQNDEDGRTTTHSSLNFHSTPVSQHDHNETATYNRYPLIKSGERSNRNLYEFDDNNNLVYKKNLLNNSSMMNGGCFLNDSLLIKATNMSYQDYEENHSPRSENNNAKSSGTLNTLGANPQKWSNKLNNSLAAADKLFECVWPFCGLGP